MSDIPQTIHQFVQQLNAPKRFIIAYSGGVDSTCLLHAVASLGVAQEVVAVHVNHQLSSYANVWQQHCEHFCGLLNVELICAQVDVKNTGEGIEARARELRLAALQNIVKPGDVVLTAHHSGDQLETFFLRLMRGAGTSGLASILPVREFGEGHIARPLLNVSKQDLLRYAKCNKLKWVEDDSNSSDEFDRNFFRNNVAATILQRWPNAERKVQQASEILQKERALLEEYARLDVQSLQPKKERLGYSMLNPAQTGWADERVNHIVRYWLKSLGLKSPSKAQLDEIYKALQAKIDQQPEIQLGQTCLRRFKNRLYCLVDVEVDKTTLSFNTDQTQVVLNNRNTLKFENSPEGLKPGEYRIEYRSGSLRCHPFGRQHSQTLKKLLQEYELEPWLRDKVPLFFSGDKLAAVGDLWVERDFYSTNNAVCIKWVLG